MFTGIIEEIGFLKGISPLARGKELKIGARKVLEGLKAGDSLAIDGVCLTVTEVDRPSFSVQAVESTLRETTLGSMKFGDKLNLERSLSLSDRLGGHFVSGHIDTVGVIRERVGGSFTMEVASRFSPLLVEKGSVAINGVSITVSRIQGNRFSFSLIPYTLKATNLGEKRVGDRVNVEFDLLGKYLTKPKI